MGDEIVVEAGAGASEAAAAEALADVAVVAIEATAERVEELTAARAEVSRLQGEISRLDMALAGHAESNALDFSALREELLRAQERINFLEDALADAERELAEVENEEPEIIAVAETPEVANVAEAEAGEPAVIPPVEHHDAPTHGKRRLISI